MDKIVVLDFGSQYSHLICRRIREFSVYAELVPYNIRYDELQKLNPTGIIFSGGPSSVYNPDYDSGVLWSSINFEWPNKHPIVSERDSKHPIFKDKK